MVLYCARRVLVQCWRRSMGFDPPPLHPRPGTGRLRPDDSILLQYRRVLLLHTMNNGRIFSVAPFFVCLLYEVLNFVWRYYHTKIDRVGEGGGVCRICCRGGGGGSVFCSKQGWSESGFSAKGGRALTQTVYCWRRESAHTLWWPILNGARKNYFQRFRRLIEILL